MALFKDYEIGDTKYCWTYFSCEVKVIKIASVKIIEEKTMQYRFVYTGIFLGAFSGDCFYCIRGIAKLSGENYVLNR